LTEKLTIYIKTIKDKINNNFSDFDNLLHLEEKSLKELEEKLNSIKQELNELI
ncbi:MAG: hypothetical protein GXO49_08460, partial [Chlorobi bacterium]|nr:hypothetical protein [Chlorobiota bacterium]